jgi:flagellar biosynthesis chaperone FliJ
MCLECLHKFIHKGYVYTNKVGMQDYITQLETKINKG